MKPSDRTHTASMKYTSGRMEERLHEERRRQQYEQGIYQPQIPTLLLPGNVNYNEYQTLTSYEPNVQAVHHQQQERQRRFGIQPREQHERGTSAPPTMTDRSQPLSPISPMSPMSSLGSFQQFQNISSLPVDRDRMNQALPPSPAQFRLGEDDLPWSMPAWYRPADNEFASPVTVRSEPEPLRRLDDPQRVRDLEDLHQAMMTVDSLGSNGWEPWTWDSEEDMPRGPRSIGWAIRSEDAPSRAPISPPKPPPYVVCQWEESYAPSWGRPRTSGT